MATLRFTGSLVIGLLAGFLLPEFTVRALDSVLPEPLDWYSRIAQKKATLIEQTQPVDVVFIGDSSSGAAFDPTIAAENCGRGGFNAAIPGSGPLVWRHFLESQVLPRLNPRVVVIGITPRMLDAKTRVDSSSWETYRSRRAVKSGLLGHTWRRLSRVSYVLRHATNINDPEQWRNIIATVGFSDVARPWLDIRDDGYDPPSEVGYKGSSPSERHPFVPDSHSLANLQHLITRLQDRASVRVVLLPVTDDWNARYDETPSLTELLSDMATIDLRAISDPALFVDENHVNPKGAALISRAFAERARLCE